MPVFIQNFWVKHKMAQRNINNVLILEIGGSHIECVHTMIHLLHSKQNKIYLACNEKLSNSVIEKDKLADLLLLPNDISKKQQFGIFFKLRKYITGNAIGTVVINTTEITIVRDMLLFLPKLNYVGIVHNAAKLEKSFTLTKLIGKRVRKVFVLGNYLLQHVKPSPVFKVAPFFPIYFPPPKHIEVKKSQSDFWIVVPGVALNKRRDYAGLLAALKKQENFPSHIKFVLLGIYDLFDTVTEKERASEWWQNHFITFKGFVDYNTFHSYMKLSDVVLPLLRREENDFYGDSRISGSFNLGLGYQLPFLLPVAYKQNTDLKPYSIYYKDLDEMVGTLEHFDTSFKQQQNDIKERYSNGPFNNIDAMADEVCNFILSK